MISTDRRELAAICRRRSGRACAEPLLGGGAGPIARFAVDAAVQARRLGEFPLGTFAVNLGGSFVLGQPAA